MRLPRVLLALASCFILISVLLYTNFRTNSPNSLSNLSNQKKGKLRSLLSFHAPSSLFQPSAIISLTDDNSTFFLARPAAFGPLLPSSGLSGPLWIGSGFSDDSLERGSGGSSSGGELGCGDVPGWYSAGGASSDEEETETADGHQTLHNSPSPLEGHRSASTKHAKQDQGKEGASDSRADGEVDEHADVESLQQSAEIAGKVVLLRRGGCGFLEKVKWAQRRGGVAVIVGDDIRGGPLVTMYARGDTSNITIPSLFTSHTTAHLLSSLLPAVSPGLGHGSAESSFDDDTNNNGQSKGPLRALLSFFGIGNIDTSRNKNDYKRPPTSGSVDWVIVEDWEEEEEDSTNDNVEIDSRNSLTSSDSDSTTDDHFIIGVHDWRDPDLVAVDQDEKSSFHSSERVHGDQPKDDTQGAKADSGSGRAADVHSDASGSGSSSSRVSKSKPVGGSWWSWLRSFVDYDHGETKLSTTKKEDSDMLRASDTSFEPDFSYLADSGPHEGLWVTLTPASMSSSPFFDTLLVLVVSPLVTLSIVYALLLLRSRIRRRRWRAPKSVVDRLPVRTYHTLPSLSASVDASATASGLATPKPPSATTPLLQHTSETPGRPVQQSHPSAAATSRQRPRSHTVAETPTQPHAMPSSWYEWDHNTTGEASTDFYQQGTPDSALSVATSTSTTSPVSEHEKRDAGLAEWRRRYGGRQRECVVCLEEYVDGVSRVMSLPCGHEFHAECITPWLTTRRRTCPICKGDVVRSMAASAETESRPPHVGSASHASSSLPATNSLGPLSSSPIATTNTASASRAFPHSFSALSRDTTAALSSSTPTPTARLTSRSNASSDAIQNQAAMARNDDPHAHSPVPFEEGGSTADLERAAYSRSDGGEGGPSSWIRSLFGGSRSGRTPSRGSGRGNDFVDRTR